MKTIKLKIKNDIDILSVQKTFNSIMHLSFNRFQEGLAEKEVRSILNSMFETQNSWLIQCAIKEGNALFQRHGNKHILFGGKINLKKYLKHQISKEQFILNRLSPISIQGEKQYKGNRLFNFNLVDNQIIFKLTRTQHIEIQYYKPLKKLYNELLCLQELIDNKHVTVSVKLNKDYIYLTYDESLMRSTKYVDLKQNRVLGIDLNPNFIGISVLNFKSNDDFKVLYKQVFDLRHLNEKNGKASNDKSTIKQTNKRHYELIKISYQIDDLINYWKCKAICLEDLNTKIDDKGLGKRFNRDCNNVWVRNLVISKLNMLAKYHGYSIIEVNPCYSSFIGNMLYGSENCPDMVASSIEIARRGYTKYQKGCFYPKFGIDTLDEQWKQTLSGVENWKEAFNKLKNLNLKYRFLIQDNILNAVLRKNYIKAKVNLYVF